MITNQLLFFNIYIFITVASNSTACTIQENSNSFIKIRSYSSKSLNDEVLSRPQQLNIPPLYNVGKSFF